MKTVNVLNQNLITYKHMNRNNKDSKEINVTINTLVSIVFSEANTKSVHTEEKKTKPHEGLLGDISFTK